MREAEREILIRYHLGKAQRALSDARSLIEGGGSPEGIVNRSYYAMFYAVSALLQDYGKIPRKHSGVISLFDTEFYKKGIFQKELSKSLHKAFEIRQKSDYREMEVIDRETAVELYEKACIFIESLSQYLRKTFTNE